MPEESSLVLIVDDAEANCRAIAALLEALGHRSIAAYTAAEALDRLTDQVDLVLLDIGMPDVDGFQAARMIRQNVDLGDVPIIMVTGRSGREDRLRAVEAGANDFIAKPVDMTELKVRVSSQLKVRRAQEAHKRYQHELETAVEERTLSLKEAQRRTHDAYLDALHRLALAAELKDEGTAAHIRRVGQYCVLLGRAFGLAPGEVETLRVASPMHDVGKIGIPDAILLKPGGLTPTEWEVMKTHTTIGDHILSHSPSELLRAAASIALTHHERWDGAGYPGGLSGEEIPFFGRICAIADVFDALTSDRPYRRRGTLEEAMAALTEGSGTGFDPNLVEIFTDRQDSVRLILEGASIP